MVVGVAPISIYISICISIWSVYGQYIVSVWSVYDQYMVMVVGVAPISDSLVSMYRCLLWAHSTLLLFTDFMFRCPDDLFSSCDNFSITLCL